MPNVDRPLKLHALLLSALLLAGCGTKVVNPVTGKAERSVMDEASEVSQGAKAHQQVLTEYSALASPPLQAYVNGIGQKLAAQSHRAELKWTFTVLDSPEVNAFALPGGYIYITRGIMAFFDSEAELAGVLGHEIGHVTARHGAQRATRQQNAGLGALAAAVLGVALEGAGVRGAADLAMQAGQGVAAGYVARYSREQELQADQLGAEYLSRSRYDPKNMVDVIGVLKSQEAFAADQARAAGRPVSQGGGWLASHPSNEQRLAEIRQIAAAFQGHFVDDGRARYLAAIDGVGYGESRAQGVTRGQNFYHEELDIALTAPPGWQVQNSPEAIALVNAAGDAGLVVRVVPASAGNSHEDIIRNLLKPSEGRVERRNVNGLAATHFNGARRNAQGQAQPLQVTLVTGPGQRTYLMQYSARDAATLRRAETDMTRAESSFRPLTAADRSAARPWQLRSVPMPRGGFAELARQWPQAPDKAESKLRLLNGLYGSGAEPAAGQMVKTVR